MVEYNYRIRERENAKEWQIKEEAGIHKGNIHSYFNEWVNDDQISDNASEASPPPQVERPPGSLGGRPHFPAPGQTQIQKGGYQRSCQKPKNKPVITFAKVKDNAAKVAYRRGQPASSIFDLGEPLKDVEPSAARLQITFEEIGVRIGSFVLPQRSRDDTNISIWGNQRQVDDTIGELRRWRSRARSLQALKESRSSGKIQFAKMRSTISDAWAEEEKTAKRNVEKQHYQKAPQQGQQFKFNGYFVWPNDEVRAIELFGPHCEALDPLRIEYRVYILFDEARSIFKIHSHSSSNGVEDVIERLENTMKEYVARNHRPTTLLLVEPPSRADYRPNVRTIAGTFFGDSRPQSKIPVSHGERPVLDDDLAKRQQELERLALTNKSRTYVAAQKVLDRMPYYRGYFRMRVNFGTFALLKFQWPPGVHSIPLERFTTDVQSAGTKGTLIRK
ncbi:MAG: hypothetical protein Q9219_003386 [cf. Caloplaca sp. 3 TL-2023]